MEVNLARLAQVSRSRRGASTHGRAFFYSILEKAQGAIFVAPRLLTALNSDTCSHLLHAWGASRRPLLALGARHGRAHCPRPRPVAECAWRRAVRLGETHVTPPLIPTYTVSSAMSEQLSSCCPLSINGPLVDHIRRTGRGLGQITPISSMGVHITP